MNVWVDWIVKTAIMLGIAAIGYLLRTNQAANEKRMEKSEENLDDLEKQLNGLKAELPYKYVQKDDFIRAITNLDQKLDKLIDIVNKERSK